MLNYSDEKLAVPPWSDATKGTLLSAVRSGKGLVVYHHSAASFQDWPEYEELVGCVWRTGQSHHSPVHNYKVDIQDANHPIMRGLASFMAETDELYAGLKCQPSNRFHVLATGWDDHSLYRAKPNEAPPSGPSRDEPLLWTLNYGSGRVFATMLGNDMRAVARARLHLHVCTRRSVGRHRQGHYTAARFISAFRPRWLAQLWGRFAENRMGSRRDPSEEGKCSESRIEMEGSTRQCAERARRRWRLR